ncbi:MAG: cation:proton antiporter [Gammaproteobacteria bacterium]|nr:cation:proton antiporter [Gammaproteobacteria bacterium]
MYEGIALLAIFILVYSSVAGLIERSWVSGPIVFTCFGFLIGADGLDLLLWKLDREVISSLAEVTLALVLFTDAADADMNVLKKTSMLPSRLLLIGLPLTILLGFALGMLMFDGVSLFAIALLATMLAPTDAALGKAVITNESVPSDVRQALNVESGLNDGICVPVLLVFLMLALGTVDEDNTWQTVLELVFKEIGIGLVVGLLLTFVAAQLLKVAWQQNWLTPTWIQLPVIALALACFTLAQYLGGSGFIAAFCGGLLFGILGKNMREKFLRAADGTGDTLALITWVVFGAIVLARVYDALTWPIFIYAVLSLTVIRMLPVFVALTGSGISSEGKLFIGWFGPRGLASIVFAVIVLERELPASATIIEATAMTIVLSILAHGITANLWATAYGKRRKLAQQGES